MLRYGCAPNRALLDINQIPIKVQFLNVCPY